MRTPAGFKKDMQFEMEVLKEHDAPGGAGQIVRGVHMRLHAGSHVDAPEHNVRGGTQIHQLPLELFIGDAVIADLRDKLPGKAITEKDLEKRLDNRIRKGDRLLLRTDHNNSYDGGSEKWMKESPYLTIGATMWCIDKGVVIVGYDFYHGNDEPDAPRVFHNSRTLSEHGIITMPYLKNLDRIDEGPLHPDRPAAQADRRRGVAGARRGAVLNRDGSRSVMRIDAMTLRKACR